MATFRDIRPHYRLSLHLNYANEQPLMMSVINSYFLFNSFQSYVMGKINGVYSMIQLSKIKFKIVGNIIKTAFFQLHYIFRTRFKHENTFWGLWK